MGAIYLPSLKAFADVCLDLCVDSMPGLSVAKNAAVGTGSALQFPPPYSDEQYIGS